MTISLNPDISLNPENFYIARTQINAEISILNRPSYHGYPSISGLTTITPKIICCREPSGVQPFHIMVSAVETTHDGSGSGDSYMDLHYEWNFGDPSGTEYFTDHYTGKIVNANDSQQGPEAAYIYRNTGVYEITLVVKGKDQNGTIVSGVTNNLLSNGLYYIYQAHPSGGTFNLLFNDELLENIVYKGSEENSVSGVQPYFSMLESGLHTLPSLNSSNCRVDYHGNVEFFGNLCGQSYSFSGDFTNLSGTIGVSLIREELPSFNYNYISVLSTGILSRQYFDSNYDGSNGSPNGTESRPYTSYSDFSSYFLGGSNRLCLLKRGSLFNFTTTVLNRETKNIRVMAYGSGSNPIFSASSAQNFNFNLIWPNNYNYGGDLVFSDIDFYKTVNSGEDSRNFRFLSISATKTGYPFQKYQNIVFDNVNSYFSTSGNSTCGMATIQALVNGGASVSSVHLWNCNVNCGSGDGWGYITSQDRWLSIMGGSYINGSGSLLLDHHVYSNCNLHSLFRYIDFKKAIAKNGVLKINSQIYNRVGVQNVLVDGCYIYGTQNGILLANSDNSYTNGRTGYIKQIITQFSKIRSGQINPTTQQIGINSVNLKNSTLRYTDFYGNRQNTFLSSDKTLFTNWYVYGCRLYGSPFVLHSGQYCYFHNNYCQAGDSFGSIQSCLEFHNSVPDISYVNLNFDNNVWYAPDETSPFYLTSTSSFIDFLTWQGSGNDINSSNTDPNWYMPQSGIFIKNPKVKVNWPDGFTNLEYYYNDAWNSCVNDNYITIESGINNYKLIQFRANAPSVNGVFNIVGSINSDSIDIDEESVVSVLIGTGLSSLYYVFKISNNYFTIKSI